MISSFDAILFDGDGVVFDSEHLSLDTFVRLLGRHGITITDEELRGFIGIGTATILQYLKTEHGLSLTHEGYSHAREEIYEELCGEIDGPPKMKGIDDLLDFLNQHGKPWALASSGSPRKIRFNLQRTELADRFPLWVSGDEVSAGKPAPDIFLEAARRLNVDPTRCLVLEDSINGLKGGLAAGASVIAIEGSHPREDLLRYTDNVFANPSEVQAYLSGKAVTK